MTLSVLSVASEAVPLIKTGGLADVVGALPAALAPHGIEVTTLVPGYPEVLEKIGHARSIHNYASLMGVPARILSTRLEDERKLLVLDAPDFFSRPGGPYGDNAGKDWDDNWRRFSALGRVAADLTSDVVKARRFHLLHAHDWQAAMGPTYLRHATRKKDRPAPSLITIHNMAFQGYFPASIFPELGLPKSAWSIDNGVEYHKGVGMLKAGMVSADAITTVSPTYALEIRTPEFGMGLDGVVRSRSHLVHGIVNGIDRREWSPANDRNLAQRYGATSLDKRIANKRAIEKELGLNRDDGPIFVVISRLTWQKGMDVLLEVIDHIVGLGGRLALLGSGDAAIEAGLKEAALRHPGRVGLRLGYDEPLAHLLQGGGDAILIPSRFEPCGLTQLYGLAYGCVPIVSRTGGLADTVVDANIAALADQSGTGIVFNGPSYDLLAQAITRAFELWEKPPVWRRIQQNGMRADFSWGRSGKAYAELYRKLVSA
jgi:starch synthase